MPSYPDISDYTDSVQNAASQVIDPALRNAKPRLKGNKPEMMSGGCAVVYPFQDGGDIYAVKCWLRDIGDLRAHYRLVESFLSSCQSTYFVGFAYVEKGIIAKDQIWPFLRMKWVGGKSVLEFVSANVTDSASLVRLAERYLAMSQQLHRLGVAHGDLQGSNIKVVGSGVGIDFQLIDYDTLIVPAAHGRKAEASALPSYQHPKRGASRCYSGKEDYFSELVIYVSLLAVAEKPTVWSKYPKGDPGMKDEDRHDKDMLFVKEDFLSERPTDVFKELFALSPLVRNLTLVLWNFTRRQTIEHLLPLEEAVRIARDFVNQTSSARRTLGFEDLLISSIGSGGGWLDDSDFVLRKLPQAAIQNRAVANNAGSFEELLLASQKYSGINADGSRTGSTTTQPQSMPLLPALVVVVIVIVLVVIASVKSNQNRGFGDQAVQVNHSSSHQDRRPTAKQSSPNLDQDQLPPQRKEPTPATNPDTPAELSQSMDEKANLRRRLAWKEDLQRRKQESDAKFDALTKQFTLGVGATEIDSFNAEVKAAERDRDEIEVEINRFNSGLEVPTRYYK